uniref:At1g61320/AtMIF1 LRR domain-containing protein n=1 Tax=Aegilops tauschii subsp. strangulata TaxID=200361 RepID=A0A453T8A1_AEGTS|nr:uncharacterized protein LOC120961804 isoform X4 [Aegilops tauschii subsp. strangulata]
MAGAGEDDAAPPPPSPDRQQPMEEAAAAAKRSRSENHHGLADGPSFRMEDLPASLELPLRPQGMFMHLRHMTCKIIVLARDVNDYNGVLQLAHWLDSAPRLETLDLHLPMQMSYLRSGAFVSAEVAGVEAPCMRRHDHLKTVFMSGFQCYKSQIELACCILGNASVLEQLTVEAIWGDDDYGRICEWAEVTSKRFGKVITVLDAPLNSE